MSTDLVVVANRLPVERTDEGRWRRSPGGLVSALGPALAGRTAEWVGWSGEASDDEDRPAAGAPRMRGLRLTPVELSDRDVRDYYHGFCNATVWPLYHDVIVPPVYRRRLWEAYRRVNRRFADAVAKSAPQGACVWVHDYQLQLVPQMLRAARPDLVIGFFLHVPFPPPELFAQLPWRAEVIEGLLGADLVGVQTPADADNLMRSISRLTPHRQSDHQVMHEDDRRRVQLRAFPISVDMAAVEATAASAHERGQVRRARRDLGDPATVLLGADRLDYTKGIDVRLKAYVELMEDGRVDPNDAVMVQVAAPSREDLEQYQRIRDEIELLIGRASGGFGHQEHVPLRYISQPMEHRRLVALFAAADVMLVTPLKDGMNLVSKEYVAARVDGDGALVLSEFAGAARELDAAWLVNPYDAEGVKRAVVAAMTAPVEERRERMSALRDSVRRYDVSRWCQDFLTTLASVHATGR